MFKWSDLGRMPEYLLIGLKRGMPTWNTLQLVSFTPFCNKINITVSFLQSSVFNKICLPFYVSDNTSLRLLLTKVATTAKLVSLLISYFKDSLQLFVGHHTAPGLAENLTQVVFRQPFVIQHVRARFLSCETWNFLFFIFFHHYILN